jgi:O-acetyl-ADP-ribose deacetylase (regulator of RNase III)
MTSHGYETRAAAARKADGESAGNATTHKMAADKLATPAAAQVMAREFASLQKGVGSQPTPSQIRAASAERARRASLAARSGHESPWQGKQVSKEAVDGVRRHLFADIGTPPSPTPKTNMADAEAKVNGTQGQGHMTLYGCYDGIQIELTVGNIADQQVQAIVSAANGELKPRGGVASALSKKGGALYDRICNLTIRDRGRPVPVTNCCVTAGGQLPARTVIHAVGVRAEDCHSDDEMRDGTKRTVYNALDTAVTLGLKEVAIPAIGAGAFHIPLHIAARAAAAALMDMTSDTVPTGTPGLKLIRWVLADAETQREFAAAFAEAGVALSGKPTTPRNKLTKQCEARRRGDVSRDDMATDESSSDSSAEETRHKLTQSGSESTGVDEPRGWKVTRTPTKMAPAQQLTTDTEAGSEPDCEGLTGESSGEEGRKSTSRPQRSILRVAVTEKQPKRAGLSARVNTPVTTESEGDDNTRGRVRFREPPTERAGSSKKTSKRREEPPHSIDTDTEGEGESPARQSRGRRERESIRHVSGAGTKLRSYEGDQYVEQYLTQFRYTAEMEGWPAREWGRHLAAALDKEARRVLRMDHKDSTGTRPSYTKLCARLRETFGPRGTPDLWRHRAETYTKGKKEPYVKMAHNISELTAKAFPDMADVDREPIEIGNFIRALPSGTLRTDVRKSRPKTMAEAVEMAEFFQDVDRVEERREHAASVYHVEAVSDKPNKLKKGKGPKGKQVHEEDEAYDGDDDVGDEQGDKVTLAQLAHLVKQLSEQIERPSPAIKGQWSSSSTSGPRKCFNCESVDHLARDCPVNKKETRNCYKCDKPGHIAKNCPARSHQEKGDTKQAQNAGRGNAQSPGTTGQSLGLTQQ